MSASSVNPGTSCYPPSFSFSLTDVVSVEGVMPLSVSCLVEKKAAEREFLFCKLHSTSGTSLVLEAYYKGYFTFIFQTKLFHSSHQVCGRKKQFNPVVVTAQVWRESVLQTITTPLHQ